MLAQQESVSRAAVAGVPVTTRFNSYGTEDYVNRKLTARKLKKKQGSDADKGLLHNNRLHLHNVCVCV